MSGEGVRGRQLDLCCEEQMAQICKHRDLCSDAEVACKVM